MLKDVHTIVACFSCDLDKEVREYLSRGWHLGDLSVTELNGELKFVQQMLFYDETY